ncbi:MAG: LCP family protein [Acidobacteriota bacterium]|nr:LCP family protein [Acidobacteriota bacterium]
MADVPRSRRHRRSGRAPLAHEVPPALSATAASAPRARAAHARRAPRRRRPWAVAGVALVVLFAAGAGAAYLYAQHRFDAIPKLTVHHETYAAPGKPFNILEIGSDSRVGLSGTLARQTGASNGQVTGQRSDVVKIMHVDPNARTISILSIPRDTTVALLANQSLYGKFNRINVNYGSGPSLLAQTITANFGIPINYTVQVSFAGLVNAAEAVGGVYLDFPYPAHDAFSGLRITHAGCQLVNGAAALAVARSRHYYYNVKGVGLWPKNAINLTYAQLAQDGWIYDGTSDYGRIDRQNAFLRAMITRVKGSLGNPLAMNAFLSTIPQGVSIDTKFTLNQMIGLALTFRHFNPANMRTYTLATTGATVNGADLLFVQQPAAQQMLVDIFGPQLVAPTSPPPNEAFQTPAPPVITSTTVSHATTTSARSATTPATSTTLPTTTTPPFDPVPCAGP